MFNLYQAFSVLKNEAEFNNFLLDILTPAELKALNERFLIAQLLFSKNLSQQEIARKTQASVTTVIRVARFLNHENHHGYQAVLQKLTHKK